MVHNITVTAFYPAVNRRQALRLYDLIPQTLLTPQLPAHPLRPPPPPLTTGRLYPPRVVSSRFSLLSLSFSRSLSRQTTPLRRRCTRVPALTQCRGMALSAGCFYDRARVKRGPGRKGLKDALISWPTRPCRRNHGCALRFTSVGGGNLTIGSETAWKRHDRSSRR